MPHLDIAANVGVGITRGLYSETVLPRFRIVFSAFAAGRSFKDFLFASRETQTTHIIKANVVLFHLENIDHNVCGTYCKNDYEGRDERGGRFVKLKCSGVESDNIS